MHFRPRDTPATRTSTTVGFPLLFFLFLFKFRDLEVLQDWPPVVLGAVVLAHERENRKWQRAEPSPATKAIFSATSAVRTLLASPAWAPSTE